jgi:dienelactone hydrolase
MVSDLSRRKFLTTAMFAGLGFNISGATLNATQKLEPLLIDTKGNPIATLGEWIKQREIIKKRWLDYLGVLRPNSSLPKISVVKEDHPEGLIRQLIEYESEPRIKVQAYLLKPQNMNAPLPGIVALHSTSDNQMLYISGVKKGNIVAFGYNMAKQGYVVICPVCFLWHNRGERSYEEMTRLFQERHPNSKGMAKMLFDAQRAVDVLQSLEEVDSSKIGALGHSLGAKEAFYLGAFDDRVKVIVSNEGGIGIDYSNWDAVWYLGKEIHDFRHPHHEVLSLVAPKPFLLIGGDSADGEISRPYIEAVEPVYKLYGEEKGKIELFNHGAGHSVHPTAETKTYDWINKFL